MKVFDCCLLFATFAFICRVFRKCDQVITLSTVIPSIFYIFQDFVISSILSGFILLKRLDGDYKNMTFFSGLLFIFLILVFMAIIFAIRSSSATSKLKYLRKILNFLYVAFDTFVFGYLVSLYAMPDKATGWIIFAYTSSFVMACMTANIIQKSFR